MEQKHRVDLLLAGLRMHPDSGAAFFDSQTEEASALFKTEPAIASGIINGLFRLTVDADFWTSKVGRKAYNLAYEWLGANVAELLALPGNDFFLGRFSATGDRGDLAELVRRSQHRDGDSVTIGVGSDILALFHEAHELLTGGIVIDGLDLANMRFGNQGPMLLDLANLFPGLPAPVKISAGSTQEPEVLSAAESGFPIGETLAPVPETGAIAPEAPAAPAAKRPAVKQGALTPEQLASREASKNKHKPAAKAAAKKAAAKKKAK